MMSGTALVRKQFLVTESHIEKIESIAKKQGTSATEVVRKAIDSFEPDSLIEVNEKQQELLDFAVDQVNEAIQLTKKTRRILNKNLKSMGQED